MKWKSFFSIAICVLVLASCGSQPASHTTDQPAAEASGMVLNDGQKWQVNEDMLPHIVAMEQAVEDFASNEVSAYHELGGVLKGHNKSLISSCTMKGASHDELHKWLYPHIEVIEGLGSAADAEAGASYVQDLKASFKAFHTYFE